MNLKNSIFIRCCYCYMISGMIVLVWGALLPSLIDEAGFSYTVAGGLISTMAIGNLLASFVFPAMVSRLGRRISITLLTLVTPVCLLLFTILPPVWVMYLSMLVIGISRGSITIINNLAVNQISDGSAKMLNFLHCSFAVGAFVTPFLTAAMLGAGFGWRKVLCLLAVLGVTVAVIYATMSYHFITEKQDAGKAEGEKEPEDRSFLKSSFFYISGLLLFFYVGMENCINGWFVTYLQSTGVMSEAFAAGLVSVIWLVIMIGRIFCAAASRYLEKSTLVFIQALGSAVFFFLLIATKNLTVITISLVGLGFFLSGIYPTSIANVGHAIKGSTLGMSVFTAISSLGGIITPQVIGAVADRIGIVAAISMLAVNVVLVVAFAGCNFMKKSR